MIVETAASTSRSLTPAPSVAPTESSRSTWISTCSPWWTRRTASGDSVSPPMADELGGVDEPVHVVLHRDGQALAVHGVRRGVGVRATAQREVLVEEGAPARDHLVAADLVVALARGELALTRDHVGPVERVVQRAPPSVDRVGGEACVEQRDDQLGTGDAGHLVVDVGRRGGDLVGLVEQVADLAQEGDVLLGVGGAGVLPVPVVDERLQLVAPRQQLAVARREVVDDGVEPGPEGLRLDPRTRERLLLDEPVEAGRDAEPADLNALVGHVTPCVFRIVEPDVASITTFPILSPCVKGR